MKLRIEIDGRSLLLEMEAHGGEIRYRLDGVERESGMASVAEIVPGVYSVLVGLRSFTIRTARVADGMEVWASGRRHFLAVSDTRDRAAKINNAARHGPFEVRTQMPGKIVKILVEAGAAVRAGERLVVVEAMKMQNELRSPKDGVVTGVYAVEGATVEAGQKLMVVN